MSNYNIDDTHLTEWLKQYDEKTIAQLLKQISQDEPHEFSDIHKYKINKLLTKTKRQIKPWWYFNAKQVAVACVLVVLVTFTSLMSVEAYRTWLIDRTVQVFEVYTEFFFKSDQPILQTDFVAKEPSVLPTGFNKTEHDIKANSNFIIYHNLKGQEIVYEQTVADGVGLILDTENADVESINIKGVDVQIIHNKNRYSAFWQADICIYSILGNVGIEKEEIIKMAESVIKQ